MKLSNFFLPHPQTHKKAILLSFPALLFYIVLFLSLNFGLNLLTQVKPGILGVASNIYQQELIKLTNLEREKNNLPLLSENPRLNQAAEEKAKNMFEENYWAHYSPSGKDPWGFIQRAGYKFSYAGENLARNFQNSDEVVSAWMASPTHKENIINRNYKDLGIAVMNGVLNGEETTLVVQEFGTPTEAVAQAPAAPKVSEETKVLPLAQSTVPKLQVAGQKQVLLDPYSTLKTFGFGIISLLLILIALDLYIIRRRGITRLYSAHLPHLAMLSTAAAALYNLNPGTILDGVSIFLH